MAGEHCIGDFVALQRGNTYKSALLDQPGPYLLGLASIAREGGFRDDKLRTYGGPTADKLLLYPGDIYVSLKDVTQSGDLLGSVARVPDSISVGRVTQDTVKLVFKHEDAPKAYLYWALRSPQYKAYCRARGMGTTNLSLSREDFLSFPIPAINEARERLVTALEAIEGKITLNNHINQTLEQIAQALFKSWFVDFEPVKAKVAALKAGGSDEDALIAAMEAVSGKTPVHLATLSAEKPERYAELRATAALFPSAMQDSELGEIPEGWSCLPLDTIAKYQNGLALQKYRPDNEDDYLPVVKIAQLKKGFADGEEKASPNIKPDCIIDDGDVVFSWSGSLMVDTWCGGKAAMNQHLFKVTSTDYPKWLYYHFTRHHLEEFQRIAESKAVTMGHIKRQHLREALCTIPDEPFLHTIGNHLGDQLSQQITLRLETKALSKLRDTLLPKLLSGELTLPDVDEAQTEPQDLAHV